MNYDLELQKMTKKIKICCSSHYNSKNNTSTVTTPVNVLAGKPSQIIDLTDSSPDNTKTIETPLEGSPFLPKIGSRLKLEKKPSVYQDTLKEFRSRIYIADKPDQRDLDIEAAHASDGPMIRRKNVRLENSIDVVMKKVLGTQV